MLKAKKQTLVSSATGFSFTPAPPSSENHIGLHYEKISRLSNQYWKYKEFYKFPMFEGKVPNFNGLDKENLIRRLRYILQISFQAS